MMDSRAATVVACSSAEPAILLAHQWSWLVGSAPMLICTAAQWLSGHQQESMTHFRNLITISAADMYYVIQCCVAVASEELEASLIV